MVDFVRWKLGYHNEPSMLQYGDGFEWQTVNASGLEAGMQFCALRQKGYELVLDDRWHPVLSRSPGPDRPVIGKFKDGSTNKVLFYWEQPMGWHWLKLNAPKNSWAPCDEPPIEWAEENPWGSIGKPLKNP